MAYGNGYGTLEITPDDVHISTGKCDSISAGDLLDNAVDLSARSAIVMLLCAHT